MKRPAWIEIDTDALKHNIREIKAKVGKCTIMAVVKADAYGHGAVECAKIFLKNGAEYLAVGMAHEALELRQGGITAPILILGWTPEDCYDFILEEDITIAIYDIKEAEKLNSKAKEKNKKAKVHIKFDTGMSRIGLMANEAGLKEAQAIYQLPNLECEGIFSHFSKADEADKNYANQQLERFRQIIKDLEQSGCMFTYRHMANSAAIMELPQAYFNMVRPGIILYGLYPSDEVKKENLDLKAAMRVMAKISRVEQINEGTLVGYGGSFIAERPTKVATVAVGYADGYSRQFSNKGAVLFKGEKIPIIGKVCMDQFMLDATNSDLKKGDSVTLMEPNSDAVSADALAKILGTISYEVVCLFALRLKREYV